MDQRNHNPEAHLETLPVSALTPEQRRTRVLAIAGKYRDALPSVDEYLREKRADAAREDVR